MKKAIISQFQGLGDILFIQPILQHLISEGYEVEHPVIPQYLWVQEYFPDIKFTDINKYEDYPLWYERSEFFDLPTGQHCFPLRFASEIISPGNAQHCNFMADKYKLMNLPVEKWRELSWKRNVYKEEDLLNLLNITPETEFILVNMNMEKGFTVQERMKELFSEPNEMRVVYMTKLPGFTMLDWAKVVELAKEVHTVETAFIYMVEVLNPKIMHMYARWPLQDGLGGVKNFISDKWFQHEYGDHYVAPVRRKIQK